MFQNKHSFLANAMLLAALVAPVSARTIYLETFERASAVAITNFNATVGGNTLGANVGSLPLSKWVLAPSAGLAESNVDDGKALQPQLTPAFNSRFCGTAIAPSTFGGIAGTYTLSFDVIAGESGYGWVHLAVGDGYDYPYPAVTDAKLYLDLVDNATPPATTGVSGQNGASATSLISLEVDEQTSATIETNFYYDGVSTVVILLGAYSTDVQYDNVAVIRPDYDQTFDGSQPAITNFNAQLGGNTLPLNTGVIEHGEIAVTVSGSMPDIGGANGRVIQPNADGNNFARYAAIFFDPSQFDGSGTYRLSFDVIGADPGGAEYRVSTGSGYDYPYPAASDAKVTFDLAANGLAGATGLTAENGAASDNLIVGSLDPTVSTTINNTFNYDGTSVLVLAFGAYNSSVQFDNVVITHSYNYGIPTLSQWVIFILVFIIAFLGARRIYRSRLEARRKA